MSTETKTGAVYSVILNEDEKALLLDMLEHTLGETRAEVHHTHTPSFREQVQRREALLRAMIEKLREPRP